MSIEKLPSFKRPPVVETVLGIQFDQIKGFTNAHLGAFWNTLAEEWDDPACKAFAGAGWKNLADAPALPPQFERFADQQAWEPLGLQLRFSSEPSCRLQIRNRVNDRMIQVQNGRLHLNWLGQSGGPYPRYRVLRPEFDTLLAMFHRFLDRQGLEKPKPNQWEVTYVNHIPTGSLWTSPAEWTSITHLLGHARLQHPVGGLDGFSGAWHFEIEPRRGRLHVEFRNGRTHEPSGKDVLMMTLTARGPVTPGVQTYHEGLNLGREAIVRNFAALTTERAQQAWEPEK